MAIHVRQADVQHGHLGLKALGHAQRLLGRVGHAQLVALQGQRFGQQIDRIAVVIDQQHAPALRRRLLALGPGPFGQRRLFAQRQAHHEAAALVAPGAVRLDLAAMQHHQVLDQRQAQAQPALRPVDALLLALVEHVEHVGQQLGGDARAVVGHLDHQRLPLAAPRQADVPAGRRVAHGVGQQVGDHLHQPRRVAPPQHGRRRQADVEPVPALLHQRLHHLGRTLQQHGRARQRGLQPDAAARDARHVQQVVDQPRHVLDLAFDDRALALGAGALALHHVQRADDGRQRVAQLVPQHGQELVLGAGGCVCALQQLLPLGMAAVQAGAGQHAVGHVDGHGHQPGHLLLQVAHGLQVELEVAVAQRAVDGQRDQALGAGVALARAVDLLQDAGQRRVGQLGKRLAVGLADQLVRAAVGDAAVQRVDQGEGLLGARQDGDGHRGLAQQVVALLEGARAGAGRFAAVDGGAHVVGDLLQELQVGLVQRHARVQAEAHALQPRFAGMAHRQQHQVGHRLGVLGRGQAQPARQHHVPALHQRVEQRLLPRQRGRQHGLARRPLVLADAHAIHHLGRVGRVGPAQVGGARHVAAGGLQRLQGGGEQVGLVRRQARQRIVHLVQRGLAA